MKKLLSAIVFLFLSAGVYAQPVIRCASEAYKQQQLALQLKKSCWNK